MESHRFRSAHESILRLACRDPFVACRPCRRETSNIWRMITRSPGACLLNPAGLANSVVVFRPTHSRAWHCNPPAGFLAPSQRQSFTPQSAKIAVFIAGANLHAPAKALGFDIDYRRLLKEFQGRGAL